jgi:hypothetical protein
MRLLTFALPACLLVLPCLCGGEPPVEEILSRLAENQERADAARSFVVYRQETRMKLMRGKGKVAREDHRIYTVTPKDSTTTKHLETFEGRYEKNGKLYPYEAPGFRHKGLDLDGDLMESLYDDLVNDEKSRDGISRDSFPLTRDQQQRYHFTLKGRQKVGGVEAYRIAFEPKKDEEWDDGSPWAGEVLVHPTEFQPIRVSTQFATNIPGWVKVMFGIAIKQLGFHVTYKKVDEGLWFPRTFGTEFHIRVLFGYARDITFSLENSDFRKGSTDSVIRYESPASVDHP